MGRGPNDDAEFDPWVSLRCRCARSGLREFNAWARWVAEHADVDSPFSAPDERSADGAATRES